MKKIPYLKEVLIHVSVWVCLSIFPLISTSSFSKDFPSDAIPRLIGMPILFYTNYFLLIPKLLLKKKVILYVLASIAFLALFNYILINSISLLSPTGMKPFEGMERYMIEERRFVFAKGFRYVFPVIFSLSFFLLGGIFSLVVDFFKRDRAAKVIQSQQKEMELQFLRTQLNPHFLFNSLNSIYSLVRSKSDEAPEAVITLSELMRYMLYEVGEGKVLLEKEINYIKHYIALQRLRLKNAEDVKLNIHGDTKNLKIHPLLLLTFIENAFKYGTDYQGNTHIGIQIDIVDDMLHFKSKNIIGLYKKDTENSGVGLKNIKNQLNYLYNGSHSLDIDTEDSYYKVDLKLKLI